MDSILSGQDFLFRRLDNDEALSTGAFGAANGIQNYACLVCGFEQSCAFVDGNPPAVRFEGDVKMLHYLRYGAWPRRVKACWATANSLSGDFMPYFPAGMSFFAAHFAATSRFTHIFLQRGKSF